MVIKDFSESGLVQEEDEDDANVEIVDISWDKGEDHLLVGLGDGRLAMIDFNGFTEDQSGWKFTYER